MSGKKLKFVFLYVFIVFSFSTMAQGRWGQNHYETANLGLVAGYSFDRSSTFEIGIGFQPWDVKSTWVGFPFAGFLALYEFQPGNKLYGTSINAWYLSGVIAGGLSVNRYATHSQETYGIKPMLGISVYRFGIMYGYNFFLTKNQIPNLYHSSFTVKYYLPLLKAKKLPE